MEYPGVKNEKKKIQQKTIEKSFMCKSQGSSLFSNYTLIILEGC